VPAAKIKVIELAKELGVTSKDLMVAAEEMGHKGVRAMSPLDSALANALRVKLGKGRDLPEAPKPKRVPKPKTDEAGDAAAGDLVARKAASRSKKAKTEDEVAADVKPAATIVKPKPAGSITVKTAGKKKKGTHIKTFTVNGGTKVGGGVRKGVRVAVTVKKQLAEKIHVQHHKKKMKKKTFRLESGLVRRWGHKCPL